MKATASFHSNRFDEAIKLAREVPTDAIDWPRAFMLLLDSYGYLGDFGPIEDELRTHPQILVPEYFLPYVCQVTIANSPAPKTAFMRLRAKEMLRSRRVIGLARCPVRR